ncbi:MAG: hydroxysqualene dehydroxylase HpnE [Thermoguttaceae bacterium]|nr:hydroxysqualene dehydroxylase HpnE [Thermoguttaceae bacterium]
MSDAEETTSGNLRVGVVGGGLAGLAAAVALTRRGVAVELFEARRMLGGRAGSFCDPQSGELVDHCQHVAMGCCTNLDDFCQTTGAADCFERRRRVEFIGLNGRRCALAAHPLLPAPLHLAPSLLGLSYLSLRDRWQTVRILGRLARVPRGARDEIAFGEWLDRQKVTAEARQRFWSVVIVSALSETLERVSVGAARQVFVDGFLAARRAYELRVPRVPLGEIYDRRVAQWLGERGAIVHTATRIRRLDGTADRISGMVMPDGSRRAFNYYVLAVPWRIAPTLLDEGVRWRLPMLEGAARLEAASITSVHVWVDRPIEGARDAALVGRLGQWVFDRGPTAGGYHYQVVISASHALVGGDREAVFCQMWKELVEVWPEAERSRPIRWRVLEYPEAVFSPRPGIDQLRPDQRTPIGNLALAGDWTATGWPATMEGAVRSGYLAAEAVLAAIGDPRLVLVADLPRGWLARRLFRA